MLWCLAMSAIRTDELMARIAAYEDPFPQKDHFHATLAPWKDRLDENALFVLTAALRKSDRRRARLVPRRWAGWLAPLRAAARARHARPRGAAASARSRRRSHPGVFPGTTHTLSPDERGVLLELPVREMVTRL